MEKRCLEMLRNKVLPCLLEHNVHDKVISMEDCAPLHTAIEMKQFLKKTFTDERVPSRPFTHEWPPRSPDLTSVDFWLKGNVNSRVYRNSPTFLVELKDAIRDKFSCI
ncbi:uncharacterized protein TNCV_1867411 [Trichonephila clavipes]|nr:uncharacterized protein TNCV_1867411 [Trichonephila clavipes]